MDEFLMKKLSEQVEKYVHSVFPTYKSELDDAFVQDIINEVVETSAFDEGNYCDSDVSLAFQRVALGRMGHPEWEIFQRNNDREMILS